MKRRVRSVSHGRSGTKREGLNLKGFLQYEMRHGFGENGTGISLKSLAIPAGFEPATHGVEIRYSIQLSYGTVGTVVMPAPSYHCQYEKSASSGRGSEPFSRQARPSQRRWTVLRFAGISMRRHRTRVGA